MRSSFAAVAVAAAILIPSAAAFAQTQANWVTPVDESTPLRACSDARCELAGTLPAGVTVLVMREEKGWYWVDVPREHRLRDRIRSAWVRAEDVRAVVADPLETRNAAVKTGASWKEPGVAAATAAAPLAGPATSATACLTCAAPKRMTSSVMLSEYGLSAAGGPGPGDPTFDANVELGLKKFGGRLLEAKKQADLTRTKVNTYIRRCYEKYVRPEDRPDLTIIVRPKRGAPRRQTITWGMLASPTSPYAWNDGWVTPATGTVHVARYCGDLWLGVHKESGDLRGIASDITARAMDEKIYPEAIHRLLVSHSLK